MLVKLLKDHVENIREDTRIIMNDIIDPDAVTQEPEKEAEE